MNFLNFVELGFFLNNFCLFYINFYTIFIILFIYIYYVSIDPLEFVLFN